MFKHSSIDFKSAGVLSKLVSDYLGKKDSLRTFYAYEPNENGFAEFLTTDPYQAFNREGLSDILAQQAGSVNNTSGQSLANIEKLRKPASYTVTTGHQLCLFTGPLYFIYKIFSTINLAESLQKKFPDKTFVPVYWMASEDHDFEEVNNFHVSGKTMTWKSQQSGAVGAFNTGELKKLLPEVQAVLGKSEHADFLISLFESAYLNHTTLAEATRFLVNRLFGDYGLVTVDGNDKKFKHQFKQELRKDVFEHLAFQEVGTAIKALEHEGYSPQVNPRTINCFYIEDGLRTRLEKVGELYNLVGTRRNFSPQELADILEKSPEKISPNVVLRPLYQQVILPNLAYVGGPGELAYWLEFKSFFDKSGVHFPILMPRNFISVVDKTTQANIKKLDFSIPDFFKSEQELIKNLQIKKDAVFHLDAEQKHLSVLYAQILERASAIDKTLSGSVSAELKRSLNGLERIAGKTNRAIRRKLETEIHQLSGIKNRLFPKNVPQERYENFSSLYMSYGPAFFDYLKANLDPFVFEQNIFTEQ